MAALNNFPFPYSDPISLPRRAEYKDSSDPQEGLVSKPWIDAFTALMTLMEKTPARIASVALFDQQDSIAATDMTDGNITTGFYEIKYHLRVTDPAAAASDLFIDLAWTGDGTSRSFTGTDMPLNDAREYDYRSIPVFIDAKTPVTYAVTYTTGLGVPMEYALHIVLQELLA